MAEHATVETLELGAAAPEFTAALIRGADHRTDRLTPGLVRREQARERGYVPVRRLLNAVYPGRGRMLEIGSGLGFLLAAFKADGWRAHGIDPDERHCRYARERHGVTTHAVAFERAGIPDEAFDLVVLGRRLPGTAAPLACLLAVNRILRAGGHCVIDLPRPSGLAATRALRQRLDDVGFRVIRRRDVAGWPRGMLANVCHTIRLDRLWPAGDQAGWQRVCLQRVRAVSAPGRGATGYGNEDAAARPAGRPPWLAEEVAGVVTVEHAHPAYGDVRRGHPWRMPDTEAAPVAAIAAR